MIAVGEASEEQLTFVSEIDRFEMEKVDAIVTIWGDRNTRALSQADPTRVSKKIASRRILTNRFWERIDQGEAKWVGTRFPRTRTRRTPRCRSRSTRTSSTERATSKPARTLLHTGARSLSS